jgi:preprotein translocase subunit SecB
VSSEKTLPLAGYALEKVFFAEQQLRVVESEEELSEGDQDMSFAWDWRVREPNLFEVLLGIGLAPTRGRPEEVNVTVCGVFRVLGKATSVGVRDFVRLQGPAILMPFAREAIGSLTGRGLFGQLLLPPINMQVLMEQQDINQATGEKQLAGREGAKLLPA